MKQLKPKTGSAAEAADALARATAWALSAAGTPYPTKAKVEKSA